MARNAVEARGLGKRYLLGEHYRSGGTLRDALTEGLHRLRLPAERRAAREELWSLRDVDLDVAEGESLGIVGRNGAGKSTLLKLLTRITEPTTGRLRTRGKVGALLEVGTGFHPELTGRENIYLNGAILGMPRREIARHYDEIVAFSGVERFLDTPVKRYSSGMYLRLAFAVAAHLQADIMVVDEVLAVGDAEFQRKCLGKMAEVERGGRTVIFVSHNLDAIARLCPRSIWLERGRVVATGPSDEVIDAYLTSGARRVGRASFPDEPGAPAALVSVAALDAGGAVSSLLRRDLPFTIRVEFDVRRSLPGLDLSVIVSNLRGLRVLDEAWSDTAPEVTGTPGRYVARLTVPPVLAVGEYSIGVWVGSAYEPLIWQDEAVAFRLEGSNGNRPERAVHLSLAWDVQQPALV
jgi:ABC-2 type transport system ATP-binding protein/lipopolysaccharide transport system ATP-binding protein